MKPKKQFRPANLRTLLVVLLIIIAAGGGALFYWGLGMVRDYAVEVHQASADAEATRKQSEELSILRNQISQSGALLEKANQLFSTTSNYQSQVLNDVKNYADNAGLSIASTNFSDPTQSGAYRITVKFKDPVSYSALITFLSDVESNLPKLQVSSIALDHPEDGGANSVTVGEINIDVSVRQ